MKTLLILTLGLGLSLGAVAGSLDEGCKSDGALYSVGIIAPVNLNELTIKEGKGEPVNDYGHPMMLCTYAVEPGNPDPANKIYSWVAYQIGWE
jgi:hypothetical protein